VDLGGIFPYIEPNDNLGNDNLGRMTLVLKHPNFGGYNRKALSPMRLKLITIFDAPNYRFFQ
jgi:hypothetical protein